MEQDLVVLVSSHLLLVTRGAVNGGDCEFTSVVSEVCVAQAFIFCVLFSRLLFDHLSFIFSLLYCLSFFYLLLLTIPFVCLIFFLGQILEHFYDVSLRKVVVSTRVILNQI
jgi:hypothetical protein